MGANIGDRGYTYCLNEMPQRNAFGGVIRCYNRIKIGEVSCAECQVRARIANEIRVSSVQQEGEVGQLSQSVRSAGAPVVPAQAEGSGGLQTDGGTT